MKSGQSFFLEPLARRLLFQLDSSKFRNCLHRPPDLTASLPIGPKLFKLVSIIRPMEVTIADWRLEFDLGLTALELQSFHDASRISTIIRLQPTSPVGKGWRSDLPLDTGGTRSKTCIQAVQWRCSYGYPLTRKLPPKNSIFDAFLARKSSRVGRYPMYEGSPLGVFLSHCAS